MLDTTTMVSAVRSHSGASRAIVDFVVQRRLTLLMDYRIACEYRDVLLRPEHVAASLLTREGILTLLDRIEALAEPVQINFRHRPLSTDPNDDLVLDLAINGRADVIVTRNLRHMAGPAKDWGISTMEPDEFLVTIRE